MNKTIIISVFFISVFCKSIIAEIKMPSIFANNMVLQQQSDVLIWGSAKPNIQTTVYTSWDNKKYKTKSDFKGKWQIKIKTTKASFTPYTITISDGKVLVIKNILIGEVWICSGQSNMEMPMSGFRNQPIENAPKDILDAQFPNIRIFTVKWNATTQPQNDCVGSWKLTSPEAISSFSATAFYFGRMLFSKLNIPIGLISSNKGGSSIEAWMNSNALVDFTEKKIPTLNEKEIIPNKTPTGLFNAMIYPIIGYGIRGAIWYQGEANVDEPDLYIRMFDKMVREWRNLWGIGEFPFYYAQIAPYRYGDGHLNSAYMREAQSKCMSTTSNTGMAVLMDAQSPYCVHPPKKRDAGERLALWALAKTYEISGISYKSPTYTKMEIDGRLITLTFDVPESSGLTSYNKDIHEFEIAGKNKRFYPAVATLFGNKVFVFSPQVDFPIAVRYAFKDISESEIFSVDGGLPLSSFRTDQW